MFQLIGLHQDFKQNTPMNPYDWKGKKKFFITTKDHKLDDIFLQAKPTNMVEANYEEITPSQLKKMKNADIDFILAPIK